SQSGLSPQECSLRSNTSSAPRFQDTNLYGPVPTSPSPLLSCVVVLPSGAGPEAACFDKIGNCARLISNSGAGALVVMRTVRGSTASVLATEPRYRVKGDGLLGTLGMRSYVNTTSSDVNGVPSENFTSGRSLNVQTLPSTVQDSASAGCGCSFESARTSGSNSVWDICVFGVSA